MPIISKRTQRRMDRIAGMIDVITHDQYLTVHRDRDAGATDRHEFWEVIANPNRVVFISLSCDGDHETITLTMDVRTGRSGEHWEVLDNQPSLAYVNVPYNVLRPVIVDFIDTIVEGRA